MFDFNRNPCSVSPKYAHPCLIVTDWHMPGMGGIEFCRQLKRDPKLAEIPVILASAGEKPASSEALWDAF
ncbi:response regulator [Paraburkholderia sp. MMS20-SJTN17]|uniref:Response regulator n=1 Tax=Paraburkholderia translucens TaxID=2886945 RepID=A0ABS8KL59_9BURK|nr:response regulator [Paraburkholderia sp. MMS20-SJTN17]